MKFGILTYHCVPNFGAQLQALSTVGYLKRIGHDVVVFNWYPIDLEKMYSNRVPHSQIEAHNAFTNTWLPVTEICRTEDDLILQAKVHKVDVILTGSDALFKYVPLDIRKCFSFRRLRFVENDALSVVKLEGNPFFGGFLGKLASKIPAAAFSISSQNCPFFKMTKKEKILMKQSLQNYSYISVRDEWTKLMVEDIMDVKGIPVTPDPVFSFNQNCYIPMPTEEDIRRKFNLPKRYVLFSFSNKFVDETYIDCLATEAERKGFIPVTFPMPEKLVGANVKTNIQLPLSPIDWYALIKYSSGYIGERMHPIVVSIHNRVPFFSFDEYGTSHSYLFGLKKKFTLESSKTFQILKKAQLTEWYYSYKTKIPLPKPEDIMDKVLKFDTIQCENFASSYQLQYEGCMKTIISLLTPDGKK